MQTESWAQQRQQARSLETQTETLFHTYSQFGSSTTVAPKASDEELETKKKIEKLLEEREALLAKLSRLLDSEATRSALKSTNLARHREILNEHRKELSRISTQISTTRDRANLLSTVQSDINTHRENQSEADYMLDERSRIDRSHDVADGVLSQAYAINESFGIQRETLTSINRRIVGAASQVPGMNTLMSKISSKKRRDGVILGSFIAFCFLIFLWLST